MNSFDKAQRKQVDRIMFEQAPESPTMEPWRQVVARYDEYPEQATKFGAAAAEIVRLEAKLEQAESDLKKIRDTAGWSGNRCRSYAEAALDRLRWR